MAVGEDILHLDMMHLASTVTLGAYSSLLTVISFISDGAIIGYRSWRRSSLNAFRRNVAAMGAMKGVISRYKNPLIETRDVITGYG